MSIQFYTQGQEGSLLAVVERVGKGVVDVACLYMSIELICVVALCC